jgi:L-fuconolactonase
MTRRDFLAATAAVAAAPVAAASAPMIPVIDTHQHLWDLRKFRLSWLKPGTPLHGNFTPTEYAEATAGLGVVKAVYMEVGMDADQQQAEADYLIELCEGKKTPTCAAVVAGSPVADTFPKYVGQFKGHKYIKGIRHMLHTPDAPAGFGLNPAFVKGVQLLGELGLSFDLCVRPGELPDHAKLVKQCPGTRFILDHCGNPQAKFTPAQFDDWKRGIAGVAALPNVVCKVSGFIANGWERGKWTADDIAPVINTTLDTFGPDRVMFGGDWPVVLGGATYSEWLTALRQVVKSRPEADQRKLFHDNAVKQYAV